jgi:hypothetical protein
MASTPGVLRIASRFFSASAVSIIGMTMRSSLACSA